MFLSFLMRRLLIAAILLLALTTVTFVIFQAIPADPARNLLPPPPAQVTNEEIQAARHALGVDKPLHVQYAKFVWRLVHGDFGLSWQLTTPVGPLVIDALKVTASLALGGALLLLLLAVPLGSLAAARAGSVFDRLTVTLTLIAISTHPIVVGLVLRLFLADHLHLMPPSGYCSIFPGAAQGFTDLAGCGGVLDWAHHLVLPWISFALFLVAIYMRMVRSRMIFVLEQPYMQTARAKGAGELAVIRRHGLRNALAPVVTMLGMDLGMALGLAIYVETVFQLPGLGRLMIGAIQGVVGYDRPVILGVVVVTAVTVILMNLVADIVTALIDPRVRETGLRRITARTAGSSAG